MAEQIYGVSSKYEFGKWEHDVYSFGFDRLAAERWLHCEQFDFRERELMSKTAATKLAGREAVENAKFVDGSYYDEDGNYFDRNGSLLAESGTDEQLGNYSVEVQNGEGYYDSSGRYRAFSPEG